MIRISYLESKLLTRNAFQVFIEQETNCKVLYSGDSIEHYCVHLQTNLVPYDICIIADCYSYLAILKIIKYTQQIHPSTYILLKSDARFMKGICFLLKHGLHGLFFTDEPRPCLQQLLDAKKKYKLSEDKTKLITKNRLGEIELKDLQYNTHPLTSNEIQFVQACAKDHSYEEIARQLQKSLYTIYGYRDRVFKKLQVKQRAAMVMTALKRNYIDL